VADNNKTTSISRLSLAPDLQKKITLCMSCNSLHALRMKLNRIVSTSFTKGLTCMTSMRNVATAQISVF